jgi:preprotein translocase subunit SecB
MKISPLQLEQYFVSELHFIVNQQFDAEKTVEIKDDQFSVQSSSLRHKENAKQWQITLQVKHQPATTSNVPYSFSLKVIGFFVVASGFPEERTEQLVKTNGSSMLYGLTREIVRDVTSRGPHAGMMLPSVSFYEAPKKLDSVPASTQPNTDPMSQTRVSSGESH